VLCFVSFGDFLCIIMFHKSKIYFKECCVLLYEAQILQHSSENTVG
jgi:hypothetical protein